MTVDDPLAPGLTLVPGSVTVNNVVVTPDPSLTSIPVGTVAAGETVVVLFQAEITAPANIEAIFLNSATVNAQYLDSNLDPVDLPPEGTNTVTINLLVEPIGFQGVIHKCRFLNETTYCVDTTWIEPFSFNVEGYRIYAGSILVANLSPDLNAKRVCVSSLSKAKDLSITAVYVGGLESDHYPIRILND